MPATDPESASPSDPRALEEENLRLRQENEELQRALREEKERIQRVLDEAERHIQEVREQDQARQQAWYAYREEMDREYRRLQALERENARMRFRVNELHLKKRGPKKWGGALFSFFLFVTRYVIQLERKSPEARGS